MTCYRKNSCGQVPAGADFRNQELFYWAVNRYRQVFTHWTEQMEEARGPQREIKVKKMSIEEFAKMAGELTEFAVHQRGYMLAILIRPSGIALTNVRSPRLTTVERVRRRNRTWSFGDRSYRSFWLLTVVFFAFVRYRVRWELNLAKRVLYWIFRDREVEKWEHQLSSAEAALGV